MDRTLEEVVKMPVCLMWYMEHLIVELYIPEEKTIGSQILTLKVEYQQQLLTINLMKVQVG
jgi:hypothetical protein